LEQASRMVLKFSSRSFSLMNRKASSGVAGTRGSCWRNTGAMVSMKARLIVILSALNLFSRTRWGRVTEDSLPALSRAVIRIFRPSLEAVVGTAKYTTWQGLPWIVQG